MEKQALLDWLDIDQDAPTYGEMIQVVQQGHNKDIEDIRQHRR
jgi:hypothetical protein